jgi:Tfp pilus assembly protein PilP
MHTFLLLAAFAVGPTAPSSIPQSTNGPASPTPAASLPASGGQTPAPTAPTPESYSYQSDGRRDPFISVIGTGNEVRLPSKRSDGPTGLTVSEVSVRGVLSSKGKMLAMIQSPDKKTYIVHAGDKLMDGIIRSITPQGLVIIQDVNDPLSLVKQREVRKPLRSAEDQRP